MGGPTIAGRRRLAPLRAALGALLALAAAGLAATAVAATRPAQPRVTSPFSSPFGEQRVIDGQVEGQAFLASLPPELVTELKAKRRVLLPEAKATGDASMAGYIKAVALFSQPKARVCEMIAQPNTQVLFLPRLTASDTVSRDETGELTEFHLAVGLVTVKYRTQHWWWPQLSRFEWDLDPSYKNDVKVANGFWQIFALDETTSVGEYGTQVDTGLPVPDALQSYFARKDIPDALEAFQKYIDSGGAWRRPD